MAQVYPDLIGAYRGKVGKAAYYEVDDKNFSRALSHKDAKEGTVAQKEQRTKMGVVGSLSGVVLPVIKLGYAGGNDYARRFVSSNMGVVTVEDPEQRLATVDYSGLQVAAGKLVPVSVDVTYSDMTYSLTTTGVGAEYGLALDDVVYAGFVDARLQFAWVTELGTRGEGGMTSVQLPSFCQPEDMHLYTFVTDAKGKKASRSLYLTVNTEGV